MSANFVIWYLEKFRNSSHNFCQDRWNRIISCVGDDQALYWIHGTVVVTFVFFWIFGTFYTFVDLTNRPAVLRNYKIQPGTNEAVSSRQLISAIPQILFNQIVAGYFVASVAFKLMQWRGLPPLCLLPTFHEILAHIAFCLACEEIGMYYSHRLLHHKFFYKRIHKKHHEWTSPVAVMSIYCHPLEHVLSNYGPPYIGVVLLGSHLVTTWLWFFLAIFTTLNAHSGYHLPFFPSPEAHNYHHLKFNECFGALGILDWLHGTNTSFLKSKAYKRHVTLLSLSPARVIVPDDDTLSTTAIKKEN